MSVGKRLSPAEPLTEHDVAERMSRTMLRLARIMQETREMGLMPDVKSSRYYPSGLLEMLRDELQEWA